VLPCVDARRQPVNKRHHQLGGKLQLRCRHGAGFKAARQEAHFGGGGNTPSAIAFDLCTLATLQHAAPELSFRPGLQGTGKTSINCLLS
jgi:hypothetical protein